MRFLTLFFCVLLCSSFQGKQNDPGETITWQAGYKLTWFDFKKPLKDGGNVEAAYTVCGIYINSNPTQVNDSTIIVDIHAFFSKTLSSKTTNRALIKPEVLKHEQGHFDLSELYARKLKRDIMEAHFKTVASFYKNVQQMYNKENSALTTEEQKYDKDTNHSINAEQQEKWSGEIANALSKYSAYANPQVRVVIRK